MILNSQQINALRAAKEALFNNGNYEEGLIIEELLDMYFNSL